MRKSVQALDSAWKRAVSDLEQKQAAGALAEDEKRDYAKFATYLGTRISEYCSLLHSAGGESAVEGLPCSGGGAFFPGADAAAAPTKAEQVTELEGELGEALGEFDALLLREERKLAARLPAEREGGPVYGDPRTAGGGYGAAAPGGQGERAGSGFPGTTGTSPSVDRAGGGETGTASSASGASQSGRETDSPAGGAGEGAGRPAAQGPRNGMQSIEAGYDDIVARQLREAAEKETDPELREKLWEEYRKYKEGIR